MNGGRGPNTSDATPKYVKSLWGINRFTYFTNKSYLNVHYMKQQKIYEYEIGWKEEGGTCR